MAKKTKSTPSTPTFDKPIEAEMVHVPSLLPATTTPVTGGLSGEWGVDDLKLPKLDLKHGVDSRFSDVTPGWYVYSRSVESDYFPLKSPFTVSFLKAEKGYIQVVEPGDIPLICRTKADVAELGGTLDKNRPDASQFQPLADCLLLIGREAHESWPGTLFFDVAGEKCALAAYRVKGSAFKEVGSVLANWEGFSRLSGNQNATLWSVRWRLGSVLRKSPSFSYFVPTLTKAGEHTAAGCAALRELAENL